jgi:hypothetical protein
MKLTEEQLAFRREIHEMRLAWEREQGLKAKAKRPAAEVLQFPDRLSEQELMRRQAVIDAVWQRTLDARQELQRAYGRGFHRGYGED